jgi:hypothetical protein
MALLYSQIKTSCNLNGIKGQADLVSDGPDKERGNLFLILYFPNLELV